MGAMVTVNEIIQLDVEANIKVKTRYGLCSLHIIFARVGRVGELQYILDRSADINDTDNKDGRTTLHWAAINSRVGTVTAPTNQLTNHQQGQNCMSRIHRCPNHCYRDCLCGRSLRCQVYFGEVCWVYWLIASYCVCGDYYFASDWIRREWGG